MSQMDDDYEDSVRDDLADLSAFQSLVESNPAEALKQLEKEEAAKKVVHRRLEYSRTTCTRMEYILHGHNCSEGKDCKMSGKSYWQIDPAKYGSITFACPRSFLMLGRIEYFSGDFAYTGELYSGYADLSEAGELVRKYADEMGTDRDRI